jgi:uncharacterized protein (TIGR03000 family)
MRTRGFGPGLAAVLVGVGLLGVPAAAQAQRFSGGGYRGGLSPYATRPLGGVVGPYGYGGYGPYSAFGYGPYSPYGTGYYNGQSLSLPYSFLPRMYNGTIGPDQFNSNSPYGAQSYYPPTANATPSAAAPAPVTVQVRVPAGAEVWFGDRKTSQTGTQREFRSPPLPPGDGYAYEVRARWQGPDGPVEQTRKVSVRAGQRVVVDFTAP